MVPEFCRNDAFFTPFRDLLHAANLRHGANCFTSLPKEGMLRIFSPEKSEGFRERTRDLGYIATKYITIFRHFA
jgi:hypothetical protein